MNKLTISKFLISLLFLMFIVDTLEAQIFKIEGGYAANLKINRVRVEAYNCNRNIEVRDASFEEQYVFDSISRLIYSKVKASLLTKQVFNAYENNGTMKTSTILTDEWMGCWLRVKNIPFVYKEKRNKYGDIKSIKSTYKETFRLFFFKGRRYHIPYRRIEKLKYIYDEKGLLISVLNKKRKIKYKISYEFFN